MTFDPTSDQKDIINHNNGSTFVKACPGAGKTRTIVQRLKTQDFINDKRQGISVLSFTNSAVEEFKEKCASEGILEKLKFPSFIGTFDSFIWKFIALPAMQAILDIKPHLMESWGDIYINLKGDKRISDRGIPLSKFDPTTRTYDLGALRADIAQTINQHNDAYVREAERRLNIFNKKGLFSTSDARKIISEALSDQSFATSLGSAINGRFKEIIIDEAQDCNTTDISILRWLVDSEVPIIVVCDPGQAIYEFRNANPDELLEFTNTLSPLPLSGNFRSTPTICKLASILREHNVPDTPLGEFKDIQEPIRVIPYSGHTVCSSTGKRFFIEATKIGLSDSNLISLAHDRKSAMRAAGIIPSAKNNKTGKRFLIADITSKFKNSGNDGRIKEKALITMISLILETEGYTHGNDSWRQVIQEYNINERELRRRALEIIGDLPGYCDVKQAEDWIEKAKGNFEKNVLLPSGKSINQLFTSTKDWYTPLTTTQKNNQIMNFATIHEAKGGEYAGVLVSIKPQSEVIQCWTSGQITEEIRVLYVGVTRAKRLIGIAIPQSQLEATKNLFDNKEINYQIIHEEDSSE